MLYYCLNPVVVVGGLYSFGSIKAMLQSCYVIFWTICSKDDFLGLISSAINTVIFDLYRLLIRRNNLKQQANC